LINIHIGKQKNLANEEEKVTKVMEHLLQLKVDFKGNLHIIAAGDFNTFFLSQTSNEQKPKTR
jgi:hypothetical protein